MLKATGVIRKVDELGRIVLPMELRRTLEIDHKDPLEIYLQGDRIVVKKFESGCIFCGEASELHRYKGKQICGQCLAELHQSKDH